MNRAAYLRAALLANAVFSTTCAMSPGSRGDTRELEPMVDAGLSPHQALDSATRISAQVLGFEQTGVIAPGYRANLVLLPEDPLTHIGAVEFPSAVMLGGYWMDNMKLEDLKDAARATSLVRSAWRALQLKL